MHRHRGFTLIELLVVIAIIGILASVVFSSLNSARSKGRDGYRATSIRQVQKAFELYADDNNGNYPVFAGWYGMDCASTSCDAAHKAALNAAFVPTYLPSWPRDPSANGGAADWGIQVSSSATGYTIVTFNSVENACNPRSLIGGYNNKSYVICSGPLSYYCPGHGSYVAQCP